MLVRVYNPGDEFHGLHGRVISTRGYFGGNSDFCNIMVQPLDWQLLPWPFNDGHGIGFSQSELEPVEELVNP